MQMAEVLAKPIESVLESQKNINDNTLGLINKYNDEQGNLKFVSYSVGEGDNKHEIKIPELTMVNIPSLSIRKFNIQMNLEDKKYNNGNKLMVSLSTEQSRWKSYKIDMEVNESNEPSMGIHRLNTILMDSVKTNKLPSTGNP
jgi:hypothetical protein